MGSDSDTPSDAVHSQSIRPRPSLRAIWLSIALGAAVAAIAVLTMSPIPRSGMGTPRDRAAMQLKAIGDAIDMYHIENRSLPGSLDDLTLRSPKFGEPFLISVPPDPWRGRYKYTIVNAGTSEYVVSTAGEDQEWGTADDMTHSARAPSR